MAGHLCVVLFAAEPQPWLVVAAWHRGFCGAGNPVGALDTPSFGPKPPHDPRSSAAFLVQLLTPGRVP